MYAAGRAEQAQEANGARQLQAYELQPYGAAQAKGFVYVAVQASGLPAVQAYGAANGAAYKAG